jgi:DNA-binding LacI/PurR family transcriptional regulator
MSVTQKDIAERLGISRALVAFALNGTGRVGDETRQRIVEEASRLGYHAHSNRNARSLIAMRYGKKVRTGVVAVLVSDYASYDPGRSPYLASLFDAVEASARELGVELAFCPARPLSLPIFISERHVDGVISILTEERLHNQITELGLPLVTVERHLPGIDGVTSDAEHGIRLTVDHLVRLGHRKIAYLGHKPDFWTGTTRLESFRNSVRRNRLELREDLIEATLAQQSREVAAEGMERLRARAKDFTALVCYNDYIGMGAIRELQREGVQVPEDISVVGFDDNSNQYGFEPAITSVRFSELDIGRRAMQLLYELVERQYDPSNNGSTPEVRHELVPVELVVRDSTAGI